MSTTVTAIFVVKVKVEMKVDVYWMGVHVDNGNYHLCCESESGNESG